MKIMARDNELQILNSSFESRKSEIIALYGRRRVGKSYLVETWAQQKIKNHQLFIHIEGLENENTTEQIEISGREICSRMNLDPNGQSFLNWNSVLDLLSLHIANPLFKNKKKVIFLDEFQWLCANRTLLVSLVKIYWDTKWKNHNVMLILCGSIASFMYKQVIHSKSLYGRISHEIKISPFVVHEAALFIRPLRSQRELFDYYFSIGGVAKYLTEIHLRDSLAKNIARLFLDKNALLKDEFEKIFSKQFKSPRSYLYIMKALKERSLTQGELSKTTKISSGGTLKEYLRNLELADFVQSYYPINKGSNSKDRKYFVCDEFSHFYLTFVSPNLKTISKFSSSQLFNKIIEPSWKSYFGLSFERFVFKHSSIVAKCCGFESEVKDVGKFFPDKKYPVQFDLVFERFDKVISIFEVKTQDKIGLDVFLDFERKLKIIEDHPYFKNKKIERGLITFNKVEKSIFDAQYFHHIVDHGSFL